MLKLKNVSKYYYQGGVVAKGISNVSLELHLGEFVVITGESGSGKSTLLNVLSGLDSYEDGEMYINGEETSHYTEEDYLKYRRRYVSNIFQNFNLVNSYTVYENIELAFLMNGHTKSEVKDKVNELIKKVDLTKYKNTHTSKLSGGQKQRVAIARALANDTPIIVADEPTGALDSKASSAILKLLHEISKEKLVIIVTHNKQEIEEYATRLIRMHDGKILENKVVEKINLDTNLNSIPVKDITFMSKLYLGFRNAFNLPVKLFLMVIIFLLISITLITNYGAFRFSEYEETSGYSYVFLNDSDKRIIVKKDNKEELKDNDYEQIAKIEGIDYIVKEDLVNDINLYLDSDYLYLDGSLYLANVDHVDVGRLPNNDQELVIVGNKENWYFSNEDLLKTSYNLENVEKMSDFKIVGILYDDSYSLYNVSFYCSDNLVKELYNTEMKGYTNTKINLDNNNLAGFSLVISDEVSKGNAYVSSDLKYSCNDNICLNKKINIKVKNIYFQRELSLNIKEEYNSSNFKQLLNMEYSDDNSIIYINKEDFDNLYGGNYQSSVFVKDLQNLDKVNNELKEMGYSTLKIKDAKSDSMEIVLQVFKIFKLIAIVCLILALFFISYFVIKIIYKSRNSYYTTLRTLGSTKKVCIRILMNELIILATFTYVLFMIFIYLVNHSIIKNEYFMNITKYVHLSEYIIVYLILILLSILIAFRYGRKIFKNSIIKTYGEVL